MYLSMLSYSSVEDLIIVLTVMLCCVGVFLIVVTALVFCMFRCFLIYVIVMLRRCHVYCRDCSYVLYMCVCFLISVIAVEVLIPGVSLLAFVLVRLLRCSSFVLYV